MTAPASARHADDPKSWTERAMTTRDLRNAVALDRIDDLTRDVGGVWADHIGTHYDGCYRYHVGCLAIHIQHILKEES